MDNYNATLEATQVVKSYALSQGTSKNGSRDDEYLVDIGDTSWCRSIARGRRAGRIGALRKLVDTSGDGDLVVVDVRKRGAARGVSGLAAELSTDGEAAHGLSAAADGAGLKESHGSACLRCFGGDFVAVWSVCGEDLSRRISDGM